MEDQRIYKVLIVEDDPMVAMINEQYISRSRNFSVAGRCRDGAGALAFLEKQGVDLLILDVFMPHMDGFETLRQIRRKKISADVIMVTAANEREALEEALHLGVVDYLVKPFTYERFQAALDKFLTRNSILKHAGTLDQKNIDFIIGSLHNTGEEIYPKGIQEKTMCLLLDHLSRYADRWLTGDEIAEKVGLTGVTVRRYMNYLAESGRVIGEMDYETGGRPCMRYRRK